MSDTLVRPLYHSPSWLLVSSFLKSRAFSSIKAEMPSPTTMPKKRALLVRDAILFEIILGYDADLVTVRSLILDPLDTYPAERRMT